MNKQDKIKQLFLDPILREMEPEKGAIGCSIARVKSIDEANRTVTAIVSTPNVDRYEEIVDPKAFKKFLKVFMTNPVFVAGHTYIGWSGEPTVIGHWQSVEITDEGLIATAKFADTALAEEYWRLYSGGHMKAFSVGWITHEWKMEEFEIAPGVRKKIRVFTLVELIEISAVAIPANRESLVRAASATRLNESAEIKQLNADDVRDLIRKHVGEEIKKQLSTEPGGPMQILIEDVVDIALGRIGHRCCDDDVHEVEADEQQSVADRLRQYVDG